MPTQTDANCREPAHFQDRSAEIIPVTAGLLDFIYGQIKAKLLILLPYVEASPFVEVSAASDR
jgi:hypothetical protein